MKMKNYLIFFKISLLLLTLGFINGCNKSQPDADDQRIIDPNPANREKDFA
jgi:hypothetical protein